jgi:hypothetical protein
LIKVFLWNFFFLFCLFRLLLLWLFFWLFNLLFFLRLLCITFCVFLLGLVFFYSFFDFFFFLFLCLQNCLYLWFKFLMINNKFTFSVALNTGSTTAPTAFYHYKTFPYTFRSCCVLFIFMYVRMSASVNDSPSINLLYSKILFKVLMLSILIYFFFPNVP